MMYRRTNVDLEIVVTTDSRGAEHYFRFELRTANRKIKLHKKKIEGKPFDDVEAFQHRILEKVEKVASDRLTEPEVVETLEKIGYDLYDEVFPSDLRDEFWRHREQIRTLLISSDGPWIPWELVKPYRDTDTMGFLCRSCVMGRRLIGANDDQMADTSFLDRLLGSFSYPIRDLQVPSAAVVTVEQSYDQSFMDLPATERDLSTLRDLLARKEQPLEVRSDATYKSFKELLETTSFGLFHFAGHGDTSIDPSQSQLHLADRPVPASFLAGPIRSKLRRERPLVFLNACRVARSGRSLTRLDGWAQRWVAGCGAGGFIAPLLSVRDDRAAEFALKFYEKIGDGWTMGEAIREARNALYEQEPRDPAWLAYSFFGHPDAKVIFGKRSRVEETLRGLLDLKAIAAVIVLFLVFGLFISFIEPAETVTVAVLSSGTEDSWRAAAVAELMHESLDASHGVRSIDRGHLVGLEAALPPDSLSDQEMAEALREALGAESMLRLTYAETGEQAILQLALASTDTGAVDWRAVEEVRGSTADLPALVRDATEHLEGPLGFDLLDAAKLPEVVTSLPADTAVAESYVQGLEAYRRSDLLGAWIHFEDARRSGAHPMLSIARARIRNDMGQREAAARELAAAAASPVFRNLPGRQRRMAGAELALAKGEWQEAIEAFQRIYLEDPRDPDACLRLVASLQRADDRAEDALARANECGIQLSAVEQAALRQIKAWATADFEEEGESQASEGSVATALVADGDSGKWTSALVASSSRLVGEALLRSGGNAGFGEELEEILQGYAPKQALARDCLRTTAFLVERARSAHAQGLLRRCLRHLDEDSGGVLVRWRKGELWLEKKDFDKASKPLRAVAKALADRGAHGLAAEVMLQLGDIDLANEGLADAWRRYSEAEEEAWTSRAGLAFALVSVRWRWVLEQAGFAGEAEKLSKDGGAFEAAREHDQLWADFRDFAEKLRLAQGSPAADTLYDELQTRRESYERSRSPSAGLRLQAALLEIFQLVYREAPIAEHQESFLNAATSAAEAGYLRDVREVRDELSKLGAKSLGSLVESLDALVEEEKADWDKRVQEALEAMEKWQ